MTLVTVLDVGIKGLLDPGRYYAGLTEDRVAPDTAYRATVAALEWTGWRTLVQLATPDQAADWKLPLMAHKWETIGWPPPWTVEVGT